MSQQSSGLTITMILVGWIGLLALLGKRAFGSVTDDVPSFGGDSAIDKNAPSSVKQWRDIVEREALIEQINPDLVLAMIWTESFGNPTVIGTSGEIGLMQIKPSTAADVGIPNREDLFEPAINIRAGVRYLAFCFNVTDSSYNALRCYNAGPSGSAINKNAGKAYANTVLNRFLGTPNYDYSGNG